MSSWSEPEWDDESRDLLVASDIVQRLTGPNGEWMPDATDPDADPMVYNGWRYVADGPWVNWAEKERLDALDAHKKLLGEDANLNGVYFGVKRVDYSNSSENSGQ